MELKQFDQAYITMQKRIPSKYQNNLSLAMYVPDGTDSAAKKRKETADNWAYGYSGYTGKNGQIKPVSIPNVPVVGFRLTGGLRNASQGSSDTAFRIEDPRGYELEIRASNLVYIMQYATIEKMEIQAECVWMRNGATNWLIPTNSPEWQETVENNKKKQSAVKIKLNDIPLGSEVFLKNGLKGIFLGGLYAAYKTTYSSQTEICHIDFTEKQYFITCSNMKHPYNETLCGDGVSIYMTKPDIVSVIPTENPLTVDECVKIVNDMNYNGLICFNKKVEYYNTLIAVDSKPLSMKQVSFRIENDKPKLKKQSSYSLCLFDKKYVALVSSISNAHNEHVIFEIDLPSFLSTGIYKRNGYLYSTKTLNNSSYYHKKYVVVENEEYILVDIKLSSGETIIER